MRESVKRFPSPQTTITASFAEAIVAMPTLIPWAKKSVVLDSREGLVVLTLGSAWLKVCPFGNSRFIWSPGRITLL